MLCFFYLFKWSCDSLGWNSVSWGDSWSSAELFPPLAAQAYISVSVHRAGISFLNPLLEFSGAISVSDGSGLHWCVGLGCRLRVEFFCLVDHDLT